MKRIFTLLFVLTIILFSATTNAQIAIYDSSSGDITGASLGFCSAPQETISIYISEDDQTSFWKYSFKDDAGIITLNLSNGFTFGNNNTDKKITETHESGIADDVAFDYTELPEKITITINHTDNTNSVEDWISLRNIIINAPSSFDATEKDLIITNDFLYSRENAGDTDPTLESPDTIKLSGDAPTLTTNDDLDGGCWNDALELTATVGGCSADSYKLAFINTANDTTEEIVSLGKIKYTPTENGTLKLVAVYSTHEISSDELKIENLIENPGTFPLIQNTTLPFSQGEIDLMDYFDGTAPAPLANNSTAISLDLGSGDADYYVYGDADKFYKFIFPSTYVSDPPVDNTTKFDTEASGVTINYVAPNNIKFYYGIKKNGKTCYNLEQTNIFVLRDKIFVPQQYFCSTDTDPHTIIIDKDLSEFTGFMILPYTQEISFDDFEFSIGGTEVANYETVNNIDNLEIKFTPSSINLDDADQVLVDVKANLIVNSFITTGGSGIVLQSWAALTDYHDGEHVQYNGFEYVANQDIPVDIGLIQVDETKSLPDDQTKLYPREIYPVPSSSSIYWDSQGVYDPPSGSSKDTIGTSSLEYANTSFYIFKSKDDGSLTLDSEYCYSEDSIELIESHAYTITKITNHDVIDQLGYIVSTGNTWKFRTKDAVDSDMDSKILNWDFYYEDNRGCTFNKPFNVTINPRPKLSYIVDNVCFGDAVNFSGSTTYPNSLTDLIWKWDFDDNTSLTDTSIVPNATPVPDNTHNGNTTGTYVQPIHMYSNAGEYNASLRVTSENGCTADSTFEITIGSYPKIAFKPTGFVENGTTSFENLSKDQEFDVVNSAVWSFDDPASPDNTLTQESILNASHEFKATGVHDVVLTLSTETNCESSDTVKVPIFPKEIVTTDNTYKAIFDDLNQGWLSSDEFDKGLPSGWKMEAKAPPFNSELIATNMIWQTGEPENKITNENSWVESPCFDISGLAFPLLSMDIYQSVEEGRDGAALQYTINDGKTWNLLGDEGVGVNWYDTRGIVSNPGNQTLTTGVGWSLDEKEWKTARFSLDDLKKEIADSAADFVRFRVAYSSDAGNAPDVEVQGFAFDNFNLTSRNRVVMMEQFVNSAHDKTLQENEEAWLDAFLVGRAAEVVDMRYHNFISHDFDPLFDINRPDISARSMEYGATMAQLTMVDGFYRCLANSEVEAKAYYKERTLTDISFDIDVAHQVSGDNLEITADITKIKNSLLTAGSQKAVVRMAIVQHAYEHNGETYNNVVVELLPNGEGNVVESIPADFAVNETMTVKGTWTPNVTTSGNKFRLVVYVQGIWGVDEVHQTWFEDSIAVPQVTLAAPTESLKSGNSNSFTIYPSPVKEKLNINWYETLENPVQWKLVTMTGSVVKQGTTPAGQIHEEIDTYQMNKGIYLLVTEDLTSLEVEQRKILIIK